MTEVLLSNDDIVVLGPPQTLEVLVDIGPQGQRGSQIFIGSGNPNSVSIGQTPYLNDLYINASPGADYAYMYQYVSQPGGNTWIEVLKVNPVIFSRNQATTYTAGEAQIIIPISNIITVTGTPLTAENFSVQYSIAHENPVSSSMSIPELTGSGENLVINFKAVEWNGTTWSALNSLVTTHLFITVVS